jgi:hypothetical protein
MPAQRPATSRLGTALRHQHAPGQLVEGVVGVARKGPFDAPGQVHLHRPGVQADAVVKGRAAQHVVAGQPCAAMMRRLRACPPAAAISAISAASKPGTSARRKRMYSTIWRRPSTSAALSWRASVASTARPSALRSWVTLARHSRGLRCGAGWRRGAESVAVGGALHQRVDGLEFADGGLRALGVDVGRCGTWCWGTARSPAPSPRSRARRPVRQVGVALASMNFACTHGARRPELVSTSTASMPPAVHHHPTASAWNSSCTPASSSQSSAAHL